MSLKDKEKWDAKYLKKPRLLVPRYASIHLQKYIDEVKKGKVLDLACGSGRNTLFLAQNGFEVDALDIAQIALDALRTQLKAENLSHLVDTKLIDLDSFSQTDDKYNLILMCNFLDRKLLQKTKQTLNKDGIFIVETYMLDDENEKEDSNKIYLLEKNELKKIFSDSYEILFYDEYDNEPHELYQMKKQVIVAKKN